MSDSRGEVTRLLAEVRLGRRSALDRLIGLVYGELRRIAGRQMRRERTGHTLQATALVHEAFLRLVDQSNADWQNRAQFFGVAAQLMRRLLVDHARRRRAAKRGAHRTSSGSRPKFTLDPDEPPATIADEMRVYRD
jgi:RNA polymerase sigma-70 factor (ECF subfamily)